MNRQVRPPRNTYRAINRQNQAPHPHPQRTINPQNQAPHPHRNINPQNQAPHRPQRINRKINRSVPSRVNDREGRTLIIDPSGRGYFLNKDLKQFHWVAQFGSEINVAEHQNKTGFVDFSDDNAFDPSLYYYSEDAGKQKLMFDITSIKANLVNDFSFLKKELDRFYPTGSVVVKQSERTPFLVNFEDGKMILDQQVDILDCLCVTRLDVKLEHLSWSLRFSVFEAHAPCACGSLNHRPIDTTSSCRRLRCHLATARTYEQLEQLTRPVHVPLIDFITYRHKTSKRGATTTYEGLLQGLYRVYAEENQDFNLDAYGQLRTLDMHKNILTFYGQHDFQNRTYLTFGLYDHTMLDVISSGMPQESNLYQWVRDIVGGLLWLHEKGLYHGCVRPHNIVIKDNQALLHGLSQGGNEESDRRFFGALLFHIFTCGSFFDNSSYIPTEEIQQELLKSDPEAYDLVNGLISGRIALSDVLMHPRFWSVRKRLDFIRLVSDDIHAGQPRPTRVTQNPIGTSALEIPLMGIQEQVFLNFHDPGHKGFKSEFLRKSFYHGVQGYGRKRKVAAVIRACRNAYSHILENKAGKEPNAFNNDLEVLHGDIKDALPNLILLMYNCLPKKVRERNDFRQLFSTY